MKTLKLKVLIATTIVAIYGLSGIAGSVFAQATFSSSTSAKYQQQKTDIKNDLAAIQFQRDRIANLKKKYKADKDAGNEIAALNDKKELIRAKGELKLSKAYLKSDKMLLFENYNLAISSHKEAMKAAKSKLEESRNRLDKNIANGNEEAVNKDALAVVQNQKEVNRHKAAIKRERSDKNSDLLAINREIRKVNGEFFNALYAEDMIANSTFWLER